MCSEGGLAVEQVALRRHAKYAFGRVLEECCGIWLRAARRGFADPDAFEGVAAMIARVAAISNHPANRLRHGSFGWKGSEHRPTEWIGTLHRAADRRSVSPNLMSLTGSAESPARLMRREPSFIIRRISAEGVFDGLKKSPAPAVRQRVQRPRIGMILSALWSYKST